MKKSLLPFFFLFLFFSNNFSQTGIPVPGLTTCDNFVSDFLSEYNIPGATFALAKDGELKYLRAFGTANLGSTEQTQPYHMFRVASVSKPITSIGIVKLMEEGQLSMNDKVFGSGGIFENNIYFNGANITDNRIYDITVQNLLEHSAGWNRDIDCTPNPTSPYPWFFGGCDPISFPLHVTELLGEPNPVTEEGFIKFLLEKGLEFTPGTDYHYSNIGFTILGEIIHELTGMEYETYMQTEILSPLGICDMHIAKNLLEDKFPREAEYPDGFSTLSCYGTGELVSWPYGGINIEAMGSHGGWIASARDLVRLLLAIDGFSTKPDILSPNTIATMTASSANNAFYAKGWSVNPSNNWWHFGGLPGTSSFIARTQSGYTWAVLLNGRKGGNYYSDLDNLPWNCLANAQSFPDHDLLAVPSQNSSGISLSNIEATSVDVNWTNGDGDGRILVVKEEMNAQFYPLDGVDYSADNLFGAGAHLGGGNYIVFNGTDNSATVSGLEPNTTYSFQLYEYAQNNVTGDHALYLMCNSPSETVTTAMPSGIDVVAANGQFTVFPNPLSNYGSFSLENNWRGEFQFQVSNLLGQTVHFALLKKTEDHAEWQIDLSELTQGIYQVTLSNGEQLIGQSFVKQ